ncbi:MAG TPA: hypothetical protein VMZ29_15875 [Candidatus Bathyarchaeia archaeon]|nr:hypothetical protein [Candidatus Bathyarchaeia archaeon]
MVDETLEKMAEGLDAKLMELIEINSREVPYFYEEGVCSILYIPVEGGELRIFHHKPENQITKRPILFAPGLGTSPWTWRYFSLPLIGQGEFYFLETRDKKSSKFRNRLKAKMTIDKSAEDIAKVINHLKLNKKDFVILGTSYCCGVILKGLIDKKFTAPTIALFDPFVKVQYYRKLISILRCTPPFIISILRFILGGIALRGEKNKTQLERGQDMVKEAVTWKWRKVGANILNIDIFKQLSMIDEEVLVFHGTKDKHHPHVLYEKIAKEIPKGRYFFLLSPEEKRELVVGIIGLELGKILSQEGIPDTLKPFEKKKSFSL